MIRLQLINCGNPLFRWALVRIFVMEVIGGVLHFRLCLYLKLHLFLPKHLHAMLCHLSECAHHPAGFILFAQLALLCLFIILIFPILPVIETCIMTQTVSDSKHHLQKHLFKHSVSQSGTFSLPCNVLFLLNRGLCVFNLLSCPSSFSLNLIINPFLFLFHS